MPLTPKNRKEQWLDGLVDHETTLTPKNRSEAWMKEIIEASGGGGGGLFVVDNIHIGETPYYSSTAAALSGGMQVVFNDGNYSYPVIQYYLDDYYITLYCGPYVVNIFADDTGDSFSFDGWPNSSGDGGGGDEEMGE